MLEFHPAVSGKCGRASMVEMALEEGDYDRLEYLAEFITAGPVDDEFANPVRYKMLKLGLEKMAQKGVTEAVQVYLSKRMTKP